jgi:protein TonB
MVPGGVEKKVEVRVLPQYIIHVLSDYRNEMITPLQKRKPEDIQKISMPNKKNEKKKQIKPSPDRETQMSVQTKVESVSVPPVKYKFLTEQIKPGMEEKYPDIYMTPDEEDNRQAALYDGEDNLLSPHKQGMQIAMPYYKRNTTPPYPEIARRRGYQGIVMLEALINQEGKVDEILLFQSSGHIILDRAAIASVKNWFFEPGKKGDETVKMWVKVPIRFQLK